MRSILLLCSIFIINGCQSSNYIDATLVLVNPSEQTLQQAFVYWGDRHALKSTVLGRGTSKHYTIPLPRKLPELVRIGYGLGNEATSFDVELEDGHHDLNRGEYYEFTFLLNEHSVKLASYKSLFVDIERYYDYEKTGKLKCPKHARKGTFAVESIDKLAVSALHIYWGGYAIAPGFIREGARKKHFCLPDVELPKELLLVWKRNGKRILLPIFLNDVDHNLVNNKNFHFQFGDASLNLVFND